MDEYAVLTRGESITLEADFVDHNLRDIGWWVDKHNRYATRQMVDFVNREVHLFPIDEAMESSRPCTVAMETFSAQPRVRARSALST